MTTAASITPAAGVQSRRVVHRSKRDPAVVRTLRRSSLGLALGGVSFTVVGLRGFAGELFVMLGVVCLVLGGFILWVLKSTYYEIRPQKLRVCSGPSRLGIPWETIESVQRSGESRSSPALSLERLRIEYTRAGKRKFVLVSPRDPERFLADVLAATDQLQPGDGGLIRA